MRTQLIAGTAVLGLAVSLACTTTPPPGRVVTGLTRVVECGGVQPPDGGSSCRPPRPTSGVVTFSREGQVVAQARSDDAGEFRVGLTPGTYQVNAVLDDFGEVAWCDEVTVRVDGRARPAPVLVTCTVAYP